jgi:hypothetical protein
MHCCGSSLICGGISLRVAQLVVRILNTWPTLESSADARPVKHVHPPPDSMISNSHDMAARYQTTNTRLPAQQVLRGFEAQLGDFGRITRRYE